MSFTNINNKKSSVYEVLLLLFIIVCKNFGTTGFSQGKDEVVVSGVRFAYPLIEKWINDYQQANANAEISIVKRGSNDPLEAQIIIDAFPDFSGIDIKKSPAFILGRYAVFPVANENSSFANLYASKGLTEKEIKALFFNDLLGDNSDVVNPQSFSFYSRLQKAGLAVTFSNHFGYEQQDIKGKAISGADEHTLLAIKRDPEGVTYNTPSLIYDLETRNVKPGLKIIPVDIDGNGKISKEEKEIDKLDNLLDLIESSRSKGLPIAPLYIYFRDARPSKEARAFVDWILETGVKDLKHYGFLNAENQDKELEKFRSLLAHNN
ncbi:MAG: hypothetical protein JJU28_15340 [Cyclobacteriaceae bacterium]|nr:hypothetical protein [Cyclobacteriaceae bacterium]